VKNEGAADLINLPAFNPAPPTKVNWGYFPGTNHIETNRVVRFMEKLMRETNICSDDIIRAFISRRVLPLKRRAHKMSEMYGPGDPTKITGLPLSKADVVLKAKQICRTDMPDNWEWGFVPLSSTNPPTDEVRDCHPGCSTGNFYAAADWLSFCFQAKDRFPRIESDKRGPCRKRPLDKVDPDPYVPWTDLKMGRTHTSRPGNVSSEAPGSVDDVTVLEVVFFSGLLCFYCYFPAVEVSSAGPQPQVHEHETPLQAEVGQEFLDKLTSGSKKNKAPATDAGSSQAPPAKRSRTEVLGGKQVGTRRYKGKTMPVSSG
jgi:hypothetical protein